MKTVWVHNKKLFASNYIFVILLFSAGELIPLFNAR